MERKVEKQVKRSVSVELSVEDIEIAVCKLARAPKGANVVFVFDERSDDEGPALTGVRIDYDLAPKQHAPAAE